MSVLDSDQINYLVFRYLQESGFQHSCFTFGQESGIMRTTIANTKIPPGALIAHLQRALNYVQAEVNMTDDGQPADLEDLENIEALTLLESVQPDVCEQRRQQLRARIKEKGESSNAEAEADKEISPDRITFLKGHESEVFTCSWHPTRDLLASGSGDSTARLWALDENGASSGEGTLLKHYAPEGGESKDVTTLAWNKAGTLLATGSYDGAARIWGEGGQLLHRLMGHSGPIVSLKWSPSCTLLVTSGVDRTAHVWEPLSGTTRQVFSFHTAPCLDVDWRDDAIFASCSTDKLIYVCQMGQTDPLKVFRGHADEVNAVQWDPSSQYLASCSDDCSAKIWSLESDECIHTFKHADKIQTLRFSPLSVKMPLMLATASFDHSAKVWDVRAGTCLHTLQGHYSPVYSVSFSPSATYLATGSFDARLLIWSLETGRVVQSYKGGGGIFEVTFNSKGDKIAVCFADRTIAVVRFP